MKLKWALFNYVCRQIHTIHAEAAIVLYMCYLFTITSGVGEGGRGGSNS